MQIRQLPLPHHFRLSSGLAFTSSPYIVIPLRPENIPRGIWTVVKVHGTTTSLVSFKNRPWETKQRVEEITTALPDNCSVNEWMNEWMPERRNAALVSGHKYLGYHNGTVTEFIAQPLALNGHATGQHQKQQQIGRKRFRLTWLNDWLTTAAKGPLAYQWSWWLSPSTAAPPWTTSCVRPLRLLLLLTGPRVPCPPRWCPVGGGWHCLWSQPQSIPRTCAAVRAPALSSCARTARWGVLQWTKCAGENEF